MILRILTALVLIPPVVYIIGWGPEWLYVLVLIAVVERGLYEYFVISRHAGSDVLAPLGYLAGALLCVAPVVAGPETRDALAFATVLLFLLLILGQGLFTTLDLRHYLVGASSTLLGVVYVGGTLSYLVPLRFSPQSHDPGVRPGRELILLLFLVIWAGDIFAYFAGRFVGRTPLFPRVSPKKTVEGAVGGFAGSMLVAWVFARWFWPAADLGTVLPLAALVAVAGQIGDLVESALKRGAEMKDSGAILPGHGGLLDRIDSLMFGAPALWLALAFRGMLRR